MMINNFLTAEKNLSTWRTGFNALDLDIDLLHGLVTNREIFFRDAGKLFKTKIITEDKPGAVKCLPTLQITLHNFLHPHHHGIPLPGCTQSRREKPCIFCWRGRQSHSHPLPLPRHLQLVAWDLRPETPPEFEPFIELSLSATSHEDPCRERW